VKSIKRWWIQVSGKLSLDPREIEDVTARELRRMMRRCPVCRGDFTQHFYTLFAMTVLTHDSSQRVRQFFKACDDRDWVEARMFQEFDSEQDAVVAYVMRCHTGRIAFLLELSPFEYYEPDRLFALSLLDHESGQKLDGHIEENDWRRLSWT
jgi:hypothetical protein